MLLIGQHQLYGGRVKEAWFTTKNPLMAVVYEGHTAVGLFMVLSGFIFTFGNRHNDIQWSGFMKNRLLRIAPLVTVMAVVGIYAFPSSFTLTGLTQHAALLSNLPGAAPLGPFSQMFWTIAVEFQFYLVFPFLLLFVRDRGWRFVVGLVTTAILLRWAAILHGANPRDMSYWTIVGRIDQFVFGIALGMVYRPMVISARVGRIGLLAVASIVVVAMLFLFHRMGGWPAVAGWKIIWPTIEGLVWAGFVLAYLEFAPLIPERLSAALCSVGATSFSIYLLHRIVIDTMTHRGWMIPNQFLPGTMNYLVNVCLIAVPITVGLSYLTFSIIERPFLDLRVSYRKKPAAEIHRQAA